MDVINKLVKKGNTTNGRDKILKAVQYLFKILIATSNSKDSVAMLTPGFSKY